MRTVIPSCIPAILALSLCTSEARADPLQVSVALERVAGVGYANARPTDASATVKLTTYGIGAVVADPLGLSRVGVDVMLPNRLTLGAAAGVGGTTLTVAPDGGQSTSVGAFAWLISPRIGYRLPVASFFDFWPRVGVTFVGANASQGDVQSCSVTFTPSGGSVQTCSSQPGASASLFAVAASADLTAVLRLTRSFNILAGGAFDYVLTATGSTTPSGTNPQSSAADVKGQYYGLELWLGVGGYLL
jgi:hypothetical protein